MPRNPRLIDLSGQTFGELTVIQQAGNTPKGAAIWLCQCICGGQSRPTGVDLRAGKVRSCGHDRMGKFHAAKWKHGRAGTRLHRIWKMMRARCANPNYTGHKDYGGRGIVVCDQWQKFMKFAEWADAAGYRDDLSIDRIDNGGNYEPKNCRWATVAEQAINKRNVPLSPDGRPWWHIARDNGITIAAYRTRIFAGWSFETATTWPMFKKRPRTL